MRKFDIVEYKRVQSINEEALKLMKSLIISTLKENGGSVKIPKYTDEDEGDEYSVGTLISTFKGGSYVSDITEVKLKKDSMCEEVVLEGEDNNGFFRSGYMYPDNYEDILSFFELCFFVNN